MFNFITDLFSEPHYDWVGTVECNFADANGDIKQMGIIDFYHVTKNGKMHREIKCSNIKERHYNNYHRYYHMARHWIKTGYFNGKKL